MFNISSGGIVGSSWFSHVSRGSHGETETDWRHCVKTCRSTDINGKIFFFTAKLKCMPRILHVITGRGCSSVVRAFAHGEVGRRIDPSCSTTGVTKAVVCVILSVGWCI